MTVATERGTLAVDDPWVDAVPVVVHRPPRPRGAGLLLTHGAGSDLDASHLVALAEGLAAGGRIVVRVDQPWRAAGRAMPPRVPQAVPGLRAVVAAIRAALGPRRGWVVGGHSNGGRVATHAATEPLAGVVGVLAVSYPLTPPRRAVAPRVDHWSAVTVPVLVLQGTADRFGGAQRVRAHLPLLPAGSAVVEVPGADHGFAITRTRSSDGRRHEPADVARSLVAQVERWVADR